MIKFEPINDKKVLLNAAMLDFEMLPYGDAGYIKPSFFGYSSKGVYFHRLNKSLYYHGLELYEVAAICDYYNRLFDISLNIQYKKYICDRNYFYC